MPLGFFFAAQVDRLVAMYSFLKVLVGPYLIQPSQAIFFLSSRTIFGFIIPNPYDEWSYNINCNAPEAYAQNGLRCSLLYNYGQNLNILLAALVVSGLVTLICKMALEKVGPNSKNHAYWSLINRYFGLRYFFVFFDAVFLELFGLCLINFKSITSSSGPVTLGFIISALVVLLYAGMYAYAYFSIKEFKKLKKSNQPIKQVDYNCFIIETADAKTNLKLFMSFFIWNYKEIETHKKLYYMPLIWPAKHALVQLVAIFLSGGLYS